MFIHGSMSGGGGTQFVSDHARAVAAAAALERGETTTAATAESSRLSSVAPGESRPGAAGCQPECGGAVREGVLSTVCDPVACSSAGGWRVGGMLCGAGDEERYGMGCRQCYLDNDEALRAERLLESQARQSGHEGGQHVIMCDTMRPPQSTNCSKKCATKLDTVSARSGPKCRVGY